MTRIVLLFLILLPAAGLADLANLKIHEERTPGGRIKESFQYYDKDGVKVKHGKNSSYYKDGELMTVALYQDGKLHGPLISYYKWIGKKHRQYYYKKGKMDGEFKTWTPTGEILYQSTWKDGDPWNGIASISGTSSIGEATETEKDTTHLYKNGSKVKGSKKIFTTVCKRPVEKFTLPDFSEFLKWRYYQYDIDSDYPHLKKLPPFESIPELINWCHKKKDSHDVAQSQIKTLTRVNFKNFDTEENYQQWMGWWKLVGSTYKNLKPVQAPITTQAWDKARKGRSLPQPKSPIYLPSHYTINFNFRSGDYGGVINETMTLKRTPKQATLTREFSMTTNGAKVKEEWTNLSVQDADVTATAIAYIIDTPWLLIDEVAINKNHIKQVKAGKGISMGGSTTDKIIGRESFHLYYPHTEFELKSANTIWWNDDPSSWGGTNPYRYSRPSNPLNSTVYPFFVSLYPESQRAKKNQSGWQLTIQR